MGSKMNLYLRLMRVLLLSLFRSRLHPKEEAITRFRVWPHDIDAFGHMNNGRYLQIMDVARVDWMRRTRVLDYILKEKCSALLGGTVIRHCKQLGPFRTYTVRTSIMAWEERWVFLKHEFHTKRGELSAVGYTRAAIRQRGDWVNLQSVVDRIAPGFFSPPISDMLRQWLAVDDDLVGENSFAHLRSSPEAGKSEAQKQEAVVTQLRA